jgi:hypothetical protein
MALPQNTRSTVAVSGLYLPPDDALTSPLLDYEIGGVAINDASQGMLVRTWRGLFDKQDGWLYLQADNETPVQWIQDFAITEFSFTFDQNMRPAVAYVSGGEMRLRWFDTTINNYRTDTFGTARNPRLALDDKRPLLLAGNSDIIFAYIRGDSLYYRQQRDRFNTERFLRSGIEADIRLKNIGMTRNLRMQFELV